MYFYFILFFLTWIFLPCFSSRSFQHQDIDGEKPALSCSPKHKIAIKPLANTKVQLYLSQMEFENLTMGRQRTELTSDRVEMALSTIVSKEVRQRRCHSF